MSGKSAIHRLRVIKCGQIICWRSVNDARMPVTVRSKRIEPYANQFFCSTWKGTQLRRRSSIETSALFYFFCLFLTLICSRTDR